MTTAQPYRIDVHHHFFPPEYVAEVRDSAAQAAIRQWTPERALEDMDQGGVAVSLTSITTPGVWVGDVEKSRRLARLCNEYAARLVQGYPGRFGFWAALPLPDAEGSLRELEYALDTLHADGVGVITSYDNKWLGDPAFDPVFEELNRRGTIVYTHPTAPACCHGLLPDVNDSLIEFGTDTTRAITRLTFSGAAARFPNVRVIFSHAGGTMPFLYERFARASTAPAIAGRLPNGLLHEIQRFFYDTAQASHPFALASLTRLIPISQILYGTDAPYREAREYPPMLAEWGFSASDLRAIEYENALRLLPDLRASRAVWSAH
jgi:predicted TIM-barrel fold metal-dependent hydrolase